MGAWKIDLRFARSVNMIQNIGITQFEIIQARKNLILVDQLIRASEKKSIFYPLRESKEEKNDPLEVYARTKALLLFQALLNDDLSNARLVLDDMIGLGNGTTPSGDDFILVLFACHTLTGGKVFTGSFIDELKLGIINNLKGKTTVISEAYLRHG